MMDSNAPQSGSKDHNDQPRPLPVLRALIDAVDHELLRLLTRRNGLVTEVAAYKRRTGKAIRDPQREREIIADRRNRATPLGLPPDTIESLFRLMLWASRDRQAALGAELPPDIDSKTIAVIGGHGAIGRLMANLFADLGHAVMIADLDTQLTAVEAAQLAEVVLVCVPIDKTVDVITAIGPHVRNDAVFADVTSTKTDPVRAMLEHSNASVVGTHPLFGPSVHSLQGQRLALVPARGDNWAQWFTQMFTARGINVVNTTAEQHDQAMAIVQVLTHFSTEVTGLAMSMLNVPLDETLRFTSPVYLMELLMTARHFAQDPDLYASIQMSNPRTEEVTATFERAAQHWRSVIDSGDRAQVQQLFQQVHDYFGDFTDQAMTQSSYLIDRLVERM